jgi:multidrug efflux pump subunit AcrB
VLVAGDDHVVHRNQGANVHDAVIEGGRRRLRPVLMTAVATMFALLPMALGVTGQGGFISHPSPSSSSAGCSPRRC